MIQRSKIQNFTILSKATNSTSSKSSKYNENLDKKSWTKVVTKTSTEIVKKLALALVEFIKLPYICCYERCIDYMSNECKSASIHNWHPHHIAAKFGHSELHEYITAKSDG